MGFETNHHLQKYLLKRIWTLSLWDLKLNHTVAREREKRSFELYPYGIWNDINLHEDDTQEEHLNFIPMGFETFVSLEDSSLYCTFELYPYGIWNC